MENKFKAGDTAYLRVQVESVLGTDETYDYVVTHIDHGNESVSADCVMAGQLYTAEEVASIVNPTSNIDWERKYHEAEAEIAELKEALEKTRVRANEAESTLADYRYIFEYMPEWREHILHELCEQWRAHEE